MIKVKNFIFYTGYVEENSWGCLALCHRLGFDSIEEATQHLGKCILNSLNEYNTNAYVLQCCKKALEVSENRFCNRCGSRLGDIKLEVDHIESFVVEILRGTMDSVPGEVWDELEVNGWNRIGWDEKTTNYDNVVIINEYADTIIAHSAFGEKLNADAKFNIVVPDGVRLYCDEQV